MKEVVKLKDEVTQSKCIAAHANSSHARFPISTEHVLQDMNHRQQSTLHRTATKQ